MSHNTIAPIEIKDIQIAAQEGQTIAHTVNLTVYGWNSLPDGRWILYARSPELLEYFATTYNRVPVDVARQSWQICVGQVPSLSLRAPEWLKEHGHA